MTVDTSNFRALRRAAAVRPAADVVFVPTTTNPGASEEAKKRPKSDKKHEYSALFKVLGLYRYIVREAADWGGFRLPDDHRAAKWLGDAIVAHEGLKRAKQVLEAAHAACDEQAVKKLEAAELALRELRERARSLTAGVRGVSDEAVAAAIERHPKVVAAVEAVKAARRAVGASLDALKAAKAAKYRAHAKLREFTLGYDITGAEYMLRVEWGRQKRAWQALERERARAERIARYTALAVAAATRALAEREAREALLAKHAHWEPTDKRPLPNLGSVAPSRARFANAAKLAHIRRVSAERAAWDWAREAQIQATSILDEGVLDAL